ncbi:MAG: arginine--tRNA ligase [Lewinellaceae bacterium]|nr:arginine--tRNA ligase [Saprospiraceae bacterium]MCB9341611.1 arginine--tRNA ligase [Lewinellaceae bacterium]
MSITDTIQAGTIQAVKSLYSEDITADQITMNVTRKEFEGDYTVVTFPFTRFAKKKPGEIAEELGQYLVENVQEIVRFNVVQGFLNLVVNDSFWREFVLETAGKQAFGTQPNNGRKVMIEYCSPNTNKPLHLGHIRNILLGWSCSQLYEAAGYDVVKVQIINDRGIAICKSMLAWQKFGHGATPESTGTKSDHFVGDYYVMFEQKFQEEYKAWQASDVGQTTFKEKAKEGQDEAQFFKDFKNTYFNEHSQLGKEAREMLQLWEAHDPATMELWRKMNGWVYEGFEETFKKLGVSFDKYYYESNTYLLGKDIVDQGLASGAFYKKDDGSVWIDLTDAKLDHKVLLRSDGTSVYMTQDLGTAQMRYKDFGAEKMVYVVADEQNYHFQVLFEILKRLGEPYANGLYHLNYGMVDLPTGKMKSREGTVVDADDLIAEVIAEATAAAHERGEIAALPQAEQDDMIRKIALAALKFHIIKVGPQKRMVFDPKESVDLQGQTGPFIQYAYVRISSVLRKAGDADTSAAANYQKLEALEKELAGQLYRFPELVVNAAETYDPSLVANYCYDLAKNFHRFFTEHSILRAESEEAKAFRLQLSKAIANVLKTGMGLLGIEMPERM